MNPQENLITWVEMGQGTAQANKVSILLIYSHFYKKKSGETIQVKTFRLFLVNIESLELNVLCQYCSLVTRFKGNK